MRDDHVPRKRFGQNFLHERGVIEKIIRAIAPARDDVIVEIGPGQGALTFPLLEQIDRNTFTALVLNPFLSEEDLLKRILLDFGVVSREEVKSGRLTHVTKQELIDVLQDFLLGLG